MKLRVSGSKASLTKPSGPTAIEQLARPFQEFSESETAGGALLLAASALALAWANSPWAGSYFTLWEHKFTIGFESFALSKSILHWINDGLMAIFFFVVGLDQTRAARRRTCFAPPGRRCLSLAPSAVWWCPRFSTCR
jgi:Na+/H+ antiporter 1